MTPDEARQLLLHEGLGDGSVAVSVRMGDDPGAERLNRIAEAIDIVTDVTRKDPEIDRQLMLALWVIAHHGMIQADSWQSLGPWRNGEYNDQIADIAMKVEDFIEGNFHPGPRLRSEPGR